MTHTEHSNVCPRGLYVAMLAFFGFWLLGAAGYLFVQYFLPIWRWAEYGMD